METTSITTDDASAPAAPEPTFDALPLTGDLRKAVDEMGYVNPTPVQVSAYEPAVQGRDLIVQARTGTGKTAAFGIPLLDKLIKTDGGAQALILAPTRELALQSSRELDRLAKHLPIETAAVYGGAPMERQVRLLKKGAQIVSGTPGRVLDHLKRGTLAAKGIRILVLDEADEMLSMGFAKELNAIMELLPTPRQTMLFSATVDDYVQRMADRHMTEPVFMGLSSDQVGATTVSHFTYFISGKGRAQDLLRILEVENPESAIIFCNTKAETERVAGAIRQGGFDADWLNGDLPQSERERIMGRTKRGELRYMVATDVAARGIDISHLTHVINFDFPESVEQYIHRTGRTGRAGRTGSAVSLVSAKELGALYYLRLQYKIFPVERSLPTEGEERTRLEADRLALVDAAFPKPPAEIDRALARRLLTHPAAERVLGGLLSAFFGARADVDEQAAAARRSRPPPSVEEADATATTRPKRRREREEKGGDRRDRDKRDERDERHERDKRDERDERETKPSSKPPAKASASTDESARPSDAPSTPPAEAQSDQVRLYVSLGKRDGIRAGDIAKLIREHTDLDRADLGRIRVRDKHSFVHVAPDKAGVVVKALHGKQAHERELVVEPAKSK